MSGASGTSFRPASLQTPIGLRGQPSLAPGAHRGRSTSEDIFRGCVALGANDDRHEAMTAPNR
jgi:hypothetical protein